MLRVPYDDLLATLTAAMQTLGLTGERAALCARLFAETTRDGVYTHGLNRFPRLVATIESGTVKVNAEPELVTSAGAIERWHGNFGVGNLNAHASMTRAIELARQHGIGAVALGFTNHWMRGGSYGWLAADHGLVGICWSNTGRNLPAWGTSSPVLGNNPLALAIPRSNPDGTSAGAPHVVLDTAMSQFSYGQLSAYAKRGEQLPVPGGYDSDGNLTQDPAAIEASFRALPIGFWKGSGLALTLDLIAASLSGGNATHQISATYTGETGLSQFFLAIDPSRLGSPAERNRIADDLIAAIHTASRSDLAKPARYPGEETLRLRLQNLELGIPVEDEVWQQIQSLAGQ